MTTASLPAGVARASRVPLALLRRGIPTGPLTLLRTRGRRTGVPRIVPVVILRHDAREWLISPFGVTQWVRNVRVSGAAEVGRGRRWRAVRLVEIGDDEKPALLHRYRRSFGIVPFVRRAFTAPPSAGPSAFRAEAHRHPVFLVTPAAGRDT